MQADVCLHLDAPAPDRDVPRGLVLGGGAEALWEALHVVRPAPHALAARVVPIDGSAVKVTDPHRGVAPRQGRQFELDVVVALALDWRHEVREMAAVG